jgi:molybdopterin synthase catalytic subunit
MSRFAVSHAPLSLDGLTRVVEADVQAIGAGCGALCTFVGVVRATHGGRRVRRLEYEGFEPLALAVFEQIAAEALPHWPDVRLAIHHRLGPLAVGEASVIVVAGAPHRGEAFQAARYAIERVKQIAPIWKHEFFEDGDAWVEGATADPADEAARQTALVRACA